IDPVRIKQELEASRVVIVPGFQGRTADWEITTLGRGGSDTTATALGVALGAEMVDIFTDVNGIMTADPRIVEEAQPLSTVT
ncbi:aspartate kinase, partial [Frankia sp. Cpl3]|nr:aspartate kinase [Frankia sp. Cpl3]